MTRSATRRCLWIMDVQNVTITGVMRKRGIYLLIASPVEKDKRANVPVSFKILDYKM